MSGNDDPRLWSGSGGLAASDHPSIRTVEHLESVLAVQVVGIGCRQHEALDLLQVGMGDSGLDQRLAQSGPAMVLDDEDVAQPGEGRTIGDDTRQSRRLPPGDRPREGMLLAIDRWTVSRVRPFAQ